MTILIIGLALWILVHWFKRLAPNLRASLGDAGKGIVAVLLGGGFGFDDHWISGRALYPRLDTPILLGACEQFVDGRGRCGVCDVPYQGSFARADASPDADICETLVGGTPVGER